MSDALNLSQDTQYKNTIIKQLRNEVEIIILNTGLNIEDCLTYAHEISPEVVYEENTIAGTTAQWVLKEQYVKDSNPLNKVLLTSLNKATFLRPYGGGALTASPSNLALGTTTASTQPITNSNGTGLTLPSATLTTAGLLSGSDKVILDGLATGAGESGLLGDGATPAIPTANSTNWKLNTVYIFNVAGTLATPLTLADGSVLTTFEASSSLKMVKTGVSTFGYILNDAKDTPNIALITTATTFTGTLTTPQEVSLPIGLNKNSTTGEVWQKTTDGIVTKIEDLRSVCVISPILTLGATSTATFIHNLNDLYPIVQGIDTAGVVLVNQANIAFTIIDSNTVQVQNGSVPLTCRIKVCGGAMVTYTPSATPIISNIVNYDPSTKVFGTNVNGNVSNTVLLSNQRITINQNNSNTGTVYDKIFSLTGPSVTVPNHCKLYIGGMPKPAFASLHMGFDLIECPGGTSHIGVISPSGLTQNYYPTINRYARYKARLLINGVPSADYAMSVLAPNPHNIFDVNFTIPAYAFTNVLELELTFEDLAGYPVGEKFFGIFRSTSKITIIETL